MTSGTEEASRHGQKAYKFITGLSWGVVQKGSCEFPRNIRATLTHKRVFGKHPDAQHSQIGRPGTETA